MKKEKKQAGRPRMGLALLCVMAAALIALTLVYQRLDGPISSGTLQTWDTLQHLRQRLGKQPEPETAAPAEEEKPDAGTLLTEVRSQRLSGWTKLSAKVYKDKYDLPLAEPEQLPESFAAVESVFAREEDDRLSLARVWVDEENTRVLLVIQSREPGYKGKYEYPGAAVSCGGRNEDGSPLSGPLNTRVSWRFAVKGWEVLPELLAGDNGIGRIDGEQILRSVTLGGLGSEDVYRQQSLAADTGTIEDCRYELRLFEEEPEAKYWSSWNGKKLSRVEPEDAARLRVRFLDGDGVLRQQFDYGVPDLPNFQAVSCRVRDLNGDGGADMIVSAAGRIYGFVYDAVRRGFRPVEELDGRTDLSFDMLTDLLYQKTEGEQTVYDLYQIKGDELSLTARLSIDFKEPVESRFSEYKVIGGQFYPRAENAGSDEIDHEKWYFVDVWE